MSLSPADFVQVQNSYRRTASLALADGVAQWRNQNGIIILRTLRKSLTKYGLPLKERISKFL